MAEYPRQIYIQVYIDKAQKGYTTIDSPIKVGEKKHVIIPDIPWPYDREEHTLRVWVDAGSYGGNVHESNEDCK